MKHNIYQYVVGIVMVAFAVTACSSNDDELGEPTQVEFDFSIPQGLADAATDNRIVELYKKYNTYFLYEYTNEQVTFGFQSGGSNMLSELDISKPDISYVGKELDLIQKTFLDFYPDDFLKEKLPFKVYLAKDIVWNTPWGMTAYWAATTGDNCLVCAWCDSRLDNLTEQQHYDFFDYVHRNYLTWLINGGKLTFPDAFFAVSDYTQEIYNGWSSYSYPDECYVEWVYIPEAQVLEAGFLDSNYTWNASQSRSTDIENYLKYMRYFAPDSEQWQYYLSFPKVKEKYDILRNYMISTYGWDPAKLGTADFTSN